MPGFPNDSRVLSKLLHGFGRLGFGWLGLGVPLTLLWGIWGRFEKLYLNSGQRELLQRVSLWTKKFEEALNSGYRPARTLARLLATYRAAVWAHTNGGQLNLLHTYRVDWVSNALLALRASLDALISRSSLPISTLLD